MSETKYIGLALLTIAATVLIIDAVNYLLLYRRKTNGLRGSDDRTGRAADRSAEDQPAETQNSPGEHAPVKKARR